MYIAMNRFRIRKGSEESFEQIWRERDSHLKAVPGFVEFRLVRGPEAEDHTLYATHVLWESQEAFAAWTRSDAFRQAHAQARPARDIYLGPPQFEGFTTVLHETREG